MNLRDSWEIRFEEELQQAQAARRAGNEGKARVCARRAAGIAIGEYLTRMGHPSPGSSAYNRLRSLVSVDNIEDEIKETASHFLLRINEDRDLPIQVDLIAEARWLAEKLNPQ